MVHEDYPPKLQGKNKWVSQQQFFGQFKIIWFLEFPLKIAVSIKHDVWHFECYLYSNLISHWYWPERYTFNTPAAFGHRLKH